MSRFLLVVSFAFASFTLAAADGVLPTGADGKPLNLDFETGTLKDWTAEGDAFAGQPVKGDAIAKRRKDMKSRHQGEYWIGGYEKAKDLPKGTLTSVPFKVTHPWASFLVGGGPHAETCVELIEIGAKEPFFRASGEEREDMRRVAVDLAKVKGKQIQVRLVDRHGGHWGHINFDDFRFHDEKPVVPKGKGPAIALKVDEYKFAGLAPAEAAAAMTVPEGFTVSLFAGEPDVHQPVAMALDDRGRLWIAEAYTYPKRHPHPGPILPEAERKKGDRIVIFEDADGDGKFDKRTVFLEGLNLVSGLEIGFGGVWIGAAPYLLFVPLDAKTDKLGEPKILLDGWGYQDTHETLNSFIWGPDGWLYGCHGVFTRSNVGKPGTPDKERTEINAGVWRYHPTRHVFEVFAHGTSNPWGLDYNDVGDFFVEACVIPHCFHIVQGGRYHRQAGSHFNPYTYADIPTIADHRHYAGATPHAGNNKSDSLGGGHAHCGLMCYLGGAWPMEYRGQLFMGNIHGRRINVDIPEPKGSSYVAKHGKDFLLANDAWARFINFRYGPDGNVYVIDWYDKQACHRNEPEIWDRTNGRIYKIRYRGTKPVTGIDLQKCSDEELVKYQLHENDWYVRHARRVLQERTAASPASAKLLESLKEIAYKHEDPLRRLRGLWALHVAWPERMTPIGPRRDASEHVRGWGVVLDDGILSGSSAVVGWASLASDPSPVVRRHMASTWLRDGYQAGFLASLLTVAQDERDPNLPYLYWYLIERTASNDPKRALSLARNASVPSLLPFTARRIGAGGTPEAVALLLESGSKATDADRQLVYLRGIRDGLTGRKLFPMPKEWPAAAEKFKASTNAEVRSLAQALSVIFGDQEAFVALRKVLADTKATLVARKSAIASLLAAQDKEFPPILQSLLAEPALRGDAIRALGRFDDAKTPAILLATYSTCPADEKRDVLNTLSSRASYGKALLDAIGAKTIPSTDVPAEIVRQLRNLQDPAIDKQIAAVWGLVRESPAERKQLIASWQRRLTAKSPTVPDLGFGRAVYAKSCQQCHTLYGVGGKVGPDITGANRADLAYLLENIFDPSAVIPKEYSATRLVLADGRVVTGLVKEETKTALTVVTATETVTIPVDDVESRSPTTTSMMPEDLTQRLSEAEIRALVAYLRNPAQVPVLATVDTAKDFFNGKDLVGWSGDMTLWSVDNGEIVGKAPQGLKRNEWLKAPIEVTDFKLSVQVKLTPTGNSGIQFRSEARPNGEVAGPQADIGAGWWGKLYEEHGRGLLVKEGGEKHVKVGDWNDYAVEAKGSRVRIWINGQQVADYTDDKLAKRGILAFQLHSGGPQEVRYRNFKLEVLE